jgi:dTMP kinase
VFITFEGIEGSGKSLQARLLVERLRGRGVEVEHTHEPGGTPLGDQLREILLVRNDLHLVARAEALLMCGSRAQIVEQVIRPALDRGDVVVCDRFGDSTLAYQGYGRGLDIAALRAMLSFATANLQPDMTILLDLPVAAGLERKHAQSAWNRFEAEARAFHERVRAGYLALAADEPRRWQCFDGLKAPEALADEIWQRISEHMGWT